MLPHAQATELPDVDGGEGEHDRHYFEIFSVNNVSDQMDTSGHQQMIECSVRSAIGPLIRQMYYPWLPNLAEAHS